MQAKLNVLIADYVPLENKGEEAIVRGIQDTIQRYADLQSISILGESGDKIEHKDGLTIIPSDWLANIQGKRISANRKRILQYELALRLYLGQCPVSHALSSQSANLQELKALLNQTDLILVGHDGVFTFDTCAILRWARRNKIRAAVYGCGARFSRSGSLIKNKLFSEALRSAEVCAFRDIYTFERMHALAPDHPHFYLSPDPAFYMQPSDPREVVPTFQALGIPYRHEDRDLPLVAVTVLEMGIVYSAFRPDLDPVSKQEAHARYLAEVFDRTVREAPCRLLFLPHAIHNENSDVDVARRVISFMNEARDQSTILSEDLSARQLKSIISLSDLLIGQRTHSIIGAISTGKPLVALSSSKDSRTHGIVEDMAGLHGYVVDIDRQSPSEVADRCIRTINNLSTEIERVREVSERLRNKSESTMEILLSKTLLNFSNH